MQTASPIPGWPSGVREVAIRSTYDGSDEPALVYSPSADEPRPLLVALHTWSYDYRQAESRPYADWCQEHGWHLVHPNFRGPNRRPEAGGSPQAIQDILDTVAHCRSLFDIDTRRIYAVGVSGGGHMSLMMARSAPEIWAGISAWVPITDLRAWYYESRERGHGYADDLMRVCGGPPGKSEAVDRQYALRSPLSGLEAAAAVSLDINAGIHDGHTGSVPVSHAVWAFNALASPRDRIDSASIGAIVANQAIPSDLGIAEPDPSYGANRVLFRRSSGRARVSLFEGGHEIVFAAALGWLAGQQLAN